MALEQLSDDFIVRHANFESWRCVKLGIDQGWIDLRLVPIIADSFLTSGTDDAVLIASFDLSNLKPTDEENLRLGLDNVVRLEMKSTLKRYDVVCWDLWLVLGLLWLCEHETAVADALCFADDIVDDIVPFTKMDFFSTAAHFQWLRSAPPADGHDPRQHSTVENEARLTQKWKLYLRAKAALYLKDYAAIIAGSS